MRYLTTIMALLLITGMTACGGGGGGSGSANTDGGSISVGNNLSTDIVFDDSLKAKWGKFRAYEYSSATNSGMEYDNGQSSNFLQWKIVQAASAEHNSVVEIFYGMQDQRWAQFHISPTAPQDLSAFESGIFSFDINMLEWGDAYDINTGSATIEARIECNWPCSSHGINIIINSTNTWKHVDINVADFVLGGADLTKLDSTLIIKPLIGYQKGVRYQLDNIQWKKGSSPAVKKKVVFEEHFNTRTSPDNWVFVPVYGSISMADKFISDGLFISPSATGPYYNNWALETTLPSTINLNHKKVSLQFKPDQRMIGLGESALEFVATDNSGGTASTPRISLSQMTALNWNIVKFDTDTAGLSTDNTFNAAAVKKLKVVFYANGKIYEGGVLGTILMDEIVITE